MRNRNSSISVPHTLDGTEEQFKKIALWEFEALSTIPAIGDNHIVLDT